MIARATGWRKLRSGSVHPDRLALAGLAERVGRDEPDLDRQAGPGMRRQIVIAGRLGFLEVEAGQRQLEFDRLVLGLAALAAADHRLDRLDPVIVGRLVVEAQRGARRGLRRLGEGDRRRVVGNDLDRPASEHRAALASRSSCLPLRRASPRRGNSACRPPRNRCVSPSIARRGTRAAAMHLREQRAAGRHLRPSRCRRRAGIAARSPV